MKAVCFIFFSAGSNLAHQFSRQQSAASFNEFVADEDFETEYKLDIYGNSTEDIRRCKLHLDNKLDKVLETVIWKDKPSYKDDKDYIPKLSHVQV